jgi:hypothetical protein
LLFIGLPGGTTTTGLIGPTVDALTRYRLQPLNGRVLRDKPTLKVQLNFSDSVLRRLGFRSGLVRYLSERQQNVIFSKHLTTADQFVRFFDTSPIFGHNFCAPVGHNTVAVDGILASFEVLG